MSLLAAATTHATPCTGAKKRAVRTETLLGAPGMLAHSPEAPPAAGRAWACRHDFVTCAPAADGAAGIRLCIT